MSHLELRDVHKAYGAVRALAGISFDVAAGSRTAVIGPSGSGKTSLLRVIAGFELPDAGSVTLDGRVLAGAGNGVPAHLRRIGLVPQDGALFPHLTVAQNVGFGLARPDPARTAELMDLVELDRALLARWPHELSGGQQQRVALARALAQQPPLMLLDEPFSALDTGLRDSARRAVVQLLSGAGITSILVTHDQAEALSYADQLVVLRNGQLVQSGSPQLVYRRPVDEATAHFLGDALVLDARLHEPGWADCELGRIALDRAAPGSQREGRILLRPEQLQLDGAGGRDGTVTETDFNGATSRLTVVLDGTPERIVAIRHAGFELPRPGTRVRVAVTGTAHLFETTATTVQAVATARRARS